ncbi:MAG: zf-HC2 domain-containing protein [Lachnospiraceae bacterium]|nr:zf-HC2 domain-containing protein [Lachnospiraceae bacterium]
MTCKEAMQYIMPYINDEMTDKEVEAFLEHIKGCRECYEELEVYYTIYAGLAQLDNDSDDFDMHNLLERALQESRDRVRRHRNFNVLYVVSQVAAILSLLVMIVVKWR